MSVPVVKVSVLTTPPSLKLKLLSKPVVQVKMLSRFPANVYALSPVSLDRTGGNYTFSLDISEVIANLPPAGVSSVFGRSGAVTAQSGDYTFAQIGSKPTTLAGYGITDAQPLDSDLTAIAALTTTSFGRAFLTLANAAASRTYLSLVPGTDIQAYDSDLAALAANNTNGIWARTGAGTGSARTITGTANAIDVANGNGVSGNPTLSISTDAALPGNPTTTTQALNNNSTRIATTAFLFNQVSNSTPLGSLATGAAGTSTLWSRADHVHPGREILTGARTYYVLTTGSDSNTGLVNNAGGAFLTIQKAINVAAALDLSIYSVTIQVGSGTYTGGVTVTGPWIGSGDVTLQGDTTTPSNVIISTTGDCVTVQTGGRLKILGFKLTSSGGSCLSMPSAATLNITGKMEFGAASFAHMVVSRAATLGGGFNYTISGGASIHVYANSYGQIIQGTFTITLTGTPAFSSGFAYATDGGQINMPSVTFSGSATGPRFVVSNLGNIKTGGAGTTYFPGSSPGSGTNPGVSPYGLYT